MSAYSRPIRFELGPDFMRRIQRMGGEARARLPNLPQTQLRCDHVGPSPTHNSHKELDELSVSSAVHFDLDQRALAVRNTGVELIKIVRALRKLHRTGGVLVAPSGR